MPSLPLLPDSIPGLAEFHRPDSGLSSVKITTPLADAEISLDGAHVLQFQPRGADPVLFVSGASYRAPGKPLRGGVPVCFPWFSARAGNPSAPAHGFARILPWTVESLVRTEEGGAVVVLRLESDPQTRAHWPYEFSARMRIGISRGLQLSLEVENRDSAPFQFEEALHTYFAISDIHEVSVTGLEGAAYLDKTDGFRRKELDREPLRFSAETDRVFPGNTATCVIHDPGLKRRITIEKSGSRSTVVWNPWIAKAAAMPDFGDDEWPGMLCIETANVGDDAVPLAAGEVHTMSAVIRVD